MPRFKLSPDVQALNPGLGPSIRTDVVRERERGPRRKAGEGTGSRTAALDELARHGWHVYGSDGAAHWMRHRDGRRAEAQGYDELLDMLLKEVRDGHV